jgi:hypothetical protein
MFTYANLIYVGIFLLGFFVGFVISRLTVKSRDVVPTLTKESDDPTKDPNYPNA